MKINSVKFNDGRYTISYEDDNKQLQSLIGECTFKGLENAPEEFIQYCKTIDFLNNLNTDSFWVAENEYMIVITKFYQVMPDDDSFHIGTIRYYTMNHLSDTFLLYFQILSKTADDFDADRFQWVLFNFYNWDM